MEPEIWAVVSTLDGWFVRLFRSEQAATDWAFDWLAKAYPEDARCCERTPDGLRQLAEVIPPMDYFFVHPCQLHDGMLSMPFAGQVR